MKSRLFAWATALVAALGLNQAAHANDEIVGAVIGGTAGALIGKSIHERNGAIVGGIVGAITGAAIADNHQNYNPPRNTYYHGQRNVYYNEPRTVYYQEPRTVYYPGETVHYRQRIEYVPAPPIYQRAPVIIYERHWHGRPHHHHHHRRHHDYW